MGYYSDPTAAAALGNINREFSRLEKKAERLIKLNKNGKLSAAELKKAEADYKGLFKHVLENALQKAENSHE